MFFSFVLLQYYDISIENYDIFIRNYDIFSENIIYLLEIIIYLLKNISLKNLKIHRQSHEECWLFDKVLYNIINRYVFYVVDKPENLQLFGYIYVNVPIEFNNIKLLESRADINIER